MAERWGEPVEVGEGRTLVIDAGACRLWAAREDGQWRLRREEGDADSREALEVSVRRTRRTPDDTDDPDADDEDAVETETGVDATFGDEAPDRLVATGKAPSKVVVRPRPPDRPVVARPEIPLEVPPGVATDVYVGMPVWVEVLDGGTTLFDAPARRLSDTWFGTNLEGVIAYATATRLRRHLDGVEHRPWRVLLPVHIVNDGDDVLRVERVQVPAPSLGIWTDGERLWASRVRIVRKAGQEADVDVDAQPPSGVAAGALQRLGDPREEGNRSAIPRVFSAITRGLAGGYA